ncbi:MAG: cytochrome c biogenesis protein ResB [Chthoniobacterales bacterium]
MAFHMDMELRLVRRTFPTFAQSVDLDNMLREFSGILTSLKLTITCLVTAMVLIFAGTIAQVHFGIHEVQQRYFQSWFVWWPTDSQGFRIPVFPGGHLIGAVLLVNLIAAHWKRFCWAWSKLGIHLTHAGLIIMLAGGLFTDLFAVDSHMQLTQGETKNYSEDPRLVELAVIDTTNPEYDQVTAVPEAFLGRKQTIRHDNWPFQIVVRNFFQNSRLHMLSESNAGLPIANQGVGAQVAVETLPRATGVDQRDVASAAIEIVPIDRATGATGPSLGTWLVSDALGAKQTFSCAGRAWQLVMRPARYYQPFSIRLQKFTHERYPGTEIPKNFSSRVTLLDPEHALSRTVLIYMNHPLRYRGETFYQAGFQKGDQASILEVVHNPSFLAPYVACVIVGLGLLVQFGYHLVGFSRRRRAALA